jgi:hypothetical protein
MYSNICVYIGFVLCDLYGGLGCVYVCVMVAFV